eukprot:UN19448
MYSLFMKFFITLKDFVIKIFLRLLIEIIYDFYVICILELFDQSNLLKFGGASALPQYFPPYPPNFHQNGTCFSHTLLPFGPR